MSAMVPRTVSLWVVRGGVGFPEDRLVTHGAFYDHLEAEALADWILNLDTSVYGGIKDVTIIMVEEIKFDNFMAACAEKERLCTASH